ncbi:P-loop containing nucleoside triphosphate hydrolase protein [Lasiosphaeris hirsuta]|uniref:P-loop containing nucleoside triphosphate hydrolase protein n=1 Tax=Lasiosphaeris hirsuta TaxID=260670 RepID=A0AA40DZX4_9PEZI|nr:P-loop containing nucleoside triphosphate hydrolase protein [Lasiosphaeris hirsuta]
MAEKMTLYKVVVLDDSGCGKTSLVIQACMLEVLDMADQEEYTALRDQWIRDGEGFVLVHIAFHRRVKESTASSPLYPTLDVTSLDSNIPIMLDANKSDQVGDREVSTQEAHALARELGCEFRFYDVVRILRRQRQVASSALTPSAG